jgi:hypothetical protein
MTTSKNNAISVSKKKCAAWLTPLLLFVIPAEAGIQSYSSGFRVKPGMTPVENLNLLFGNGTMYSWRLPAARGHPQAALEAATHNS